MAMEKFGASERFACQVLGQNRSALRKKKSPMSFNEAQLRADLRTIASKHPTWGWRKAPWHLLATERWARHCLEQQAHPTIMARRRHGL